MQPRGRKCKAAKYWMGVLQDEEFYREVETKSGCAGLERLQAVPDSLEKTQSSEGVSNGVDRRCSLRAGS